MKNTDKANAGSIKIGITSLVTYAENAQYHEDRAYWAIQRDVENRGYEFDRDAVRRRMDKVRMGDGGDQYDALTLTTYLP